MLAAGDEAGRIGRSSHQTSARTMSASARDDTGRRMPDHYRRVVKDVVSYLRRYGATSSTFPPNPLVQLPPTHFFDQFYKSSYRKIEAESGAVLRLNKGTNSVVVMGNLYDVAGLIQMPYEEDWNDFKVPVFGSSVGAVASLIEYHALTDELARRFGGPNFLFQSAHYRSADYRSRSVWAVEITERSSPRKPPDMERFIERFRSSPQRLIELKTEEPIGALTHLLKTEGGKNATHIMHLLREPPRGYLANQYTDNDNRSVWDSAGFLLNSNGDVTSVVLRFSEGARSGHQFIITREVALFGEVSGGKIIWSAPNIGSDVDGKALFESYRATITRIFAGNVRHSFEESPPSEPSSGAAQGSSVTGLAEDTGETIGGANVMGAADVHRATRGTAGRTQRRFGHTQLAGARAAIRTPTLRPVASPIAGRTTVVR